VRVLAGEEDRPAAADGGGGYMRGLARRRARAQRAAAALEPLEQVADASVARDSAEEAWTRRAYLVERDRLGEFRHRLDRLTESRPELRVTCTGPWAPYSFVSEEQAA
jgi:hypothetical protein